MNNVTLSYELLALLAWLVDNNQAALKQLVEHALSAGLQEEIRKINASDDPNDMYELQNSITDFLSILETMLLESSSNRTQRKQPYKSLINTLDNIDPLECDTSLVNFSLEETTAKLEQNPHGNPKEMLLKELLRNWQPRDKEIKN